MSAARMNGRVTVTVVAAALLLAATGAFTLQAAAQQTSTMDAVYTAEQAKRGLETIALQGEAARKFRAAAFENLWADIKRRSPDMADQLRAKFYN